MFSDGVVVVGVGAGTDTLLRVVVHACSKVQVYKMD